MTIPTVAVVVEPPATATTTSATAPEAAATTAKGPHLFKLGRNIGLGLAQDSQELARLLRVVRGKVRVCRPLVSGPPRPPDAVDVIFAVVREVVVDDIADVLHV